MIKTIGLKPKLTTLLLIVLSFVAAPSMAGNPAAVNARQKPLEYAIGPEDVIEVLVWKNAELSKTVTVRPDGKISLPLIGDIQAAGLTPSELCDSISARLKEYQETVTASVIVQAVNSYRVFIMGEVKTPGAYQLKSRTTLLQAISLAGGFTQFASRNSMVLIRQNRDGGEDKTAVRFNDLVYGNEGTGKDLVLRPGDTVFVP